MNASMNGFRSSSQSHVGMVRQLNEDSYISRDEIGLWAVADGMGGHQAGDVASRQVVECLDAVSAAADIGELLFATRSAIKDANSRLLSMADQYDASRIPGSTVAALVLKDRQAAVTWAGDSRIYRLRGDRVEQITRDHSHVQELIDQRLIDPEEAEHHPMANVITRAVGIQQGLELDVLHFDLARDDRFLLCSDGLSRLASLDEIRDRLSGGNLEEAVRSLLNIALDRGAPDNVTLIAVECVEPQPAAGLDDEDDADVTRIFPGG